MTDGHSLKVAEWLTPAEARVLADASELAFELDERANRAAYLADRVPESIGAARIAERAKAAQHAVDGLLIALRVYADSDEAAAVLDSNTVPTGPRAE